MKAEIKPAAEPLTKAEIARRAEKYGKSVLSAMSKKTRKL